MEEEIRRRSSYGLQSAVKVSSPTASESEAQIYDYLSRVFQNEVEYDLTTLKSPRGRIAYTIEECIKARWPRLDLFVIGTRGQTGLKKYCLCFVYAL